MMIENDGAANSVPPLSLKGGGHRRPSAAALSTKNADAKHRLWWGSRRHTWGLAVAPKSTPTRQHVLRVAKHMLPTSPFQGEAELAAKAQIFVTTSACFNIP
jgi:hypothetical protein